MDGQTREVLFNYLNVLLAGTRLSCATYDTNGRLKSRLRLLHWTRGLQCRKCGDPVTVSGPIFDEGIRCVQCGTILRVPPWYCRLLVLLSYGIAVAYLWVVGVRNLGISLILLLPVSRSILPIIVRLTIIVLPPRLVTGKRPSSVITLDLRGD